MYVITEIKSHGYLLFLMQNKLVLCKVSSSSGCIVTYITGIIQSFVFRLLVSQKIFFLYFRYIHKMRMDILFCHVLTACE